MANIRYRLFDEEFVESQGMMLTRVFQTLLNRHSDKVPEAVETFSCLASVDYHQELEALRSAKSIFLNKQTFQAGTETVCIGTSCNLPEKRRLITRLFTLCGEGSDQFEILETKAAGNTPSSKAKQANKTNRHGISYRFFDKRQFSTQADMLYNIVSEILLQKPGLTDWAAENLNCVSKTDYTKQENQTNMPSTFHNCRPLEVNGQRLYIATAYGLKRKQHYIDRLLKEAGLPEDAFEVYPDYNMPPLAYWQKKMAEAVLDRLRAIAHDSGALGIISMPSGCGKSLVLAEISRRLLEAGSAWSVLILTNTATMAERYKARLGELLAGFCPVELAASQKDLKIKSEKPGVLLISTAQKLLFHRKKSDAFPYSSEAPPYSESPQILVIVEEAPYHYFSRTYADMQCRFPNAVFLGVTQDPSPSLRMEKYFGPLLYRYSWADAFEDGFLKPFRCREIVFEAPAAELGQPYRADRLLFMERMREIAEWIAAEERDKSHCALLLCQNQDAAVQYHDLLLPLMGSGRLRICLPANLIGWQSRMGKSEDIEQSRWNGEYFSGIVIACTTSLVNRPFRKVYLDKNASRFELLDISSMLMRNTAPYEEDSVLVSFYPMRSLLEDLLGVYIPTVEVPFWSHDSLESFQENITRALTSRQYETVDAVLRQMRRFYPEDEERLTEQLVFLYPRGMEKTQRPQYWEQHPEKLAWQSDLWCLLSRDSALRWEELHILESPAAEKSENAEEDTRAAISAGTPQQRGARLESAVKSLLKFLFELDSDEPLDSLRVQNSGLQFGFDIMLKYRDRSNIQITCAIECKNYSGTIHPADVLEKLASRQMAGTRVDHWILISPHGKISNELREMSEKWKEEDFWAPVLDIQFWTPDEGIQDLFGLFPEIYQTFYEAAEGNDPSCWSTEKKDRIAVHWKNKLAHVPHLPAKWKTYLREPKYLLTERETDPETSCSYEQLYRCRVPMRLLDQNELPIEGLAEEYFFKWLQKPERACALLLGDFGDGKSFFTYVLARQLAEKFWISPEAGWIPLRLSLRELGDQRIGFRQVLKNRLDEFCDGVQSWNEVRERYKFLIILDGLDEMSLGMNDTAVLDNLSILEGLIEQFSGYKILVTSRKMVIYADKVHDRIVSVLKRPEILHLAPISRSDCVDFLKQHASTSARKKRLSKIRNTHDLLGLAEKPLFLSMILAQMDNDDIQTNDMFGIYQTHAQKALERKFNYQLKMSGDHTSRERFIANLFALLEELAIYMQFTGKDSVSLEEFKAHISINSFVQYLWSCEDSLDAEREQDASYRISSRSLLKYDKAHPENRCFCHRSMKEFFLACGIVRKLCEDKDSVRELFMKSSLSYEICLFAGKAFQKLPPLQHKLVRRNLVDFAHETKGMRTAPQRNCFANLGANSVNLLHCGKFGFPGEDWSGLVLDNAALSGADLHEKNLSQCSMRFAHLDNADLSACDLRGCDFTGVQFEKSGRLRGFALDTHGDALLAYYQDGKLRIWRSDSGDMQEAIQLEPQKWVRFILGLSGQEGAAFPGRFQFWDRSAGALNATGHIALRHGVQLLDMEYTSALIRQGQNMFLLKAGSGEILRKWQFSGTIIHAALLSEQACVMWLEEQALVLVNAAGEFDCSSLALRDGQVTSLNVGMITQTERRIVLGYEDGRVKCFAAVYEENSKAWSIGAAVNQLKCGSQVVDTACYGPDELFVGTSSGAITQYRINDLGEFEPDKIYRLELKCLNARIEGVQPPEQYEILRWAVNHCLNDE